MKISTKGRYALRLMLDLALHENQDPVPLKDVAARQDISLKYLEQIISILQKAGFVRSLRGPQGGYYLAKAPADYTVGSILRLIEGDLCPVACLEDTPNKCPRKETCVTLRLWTELDEAIKGVIDKYTLADLSNWAREGVGDYII